MSAVIPTHMNSVSCTYARTFTLTYRESVYPRRTHPQGELRLRHRVTPIKLMNNKPLSSLLTQC